MMLNLCRNSHTITRHLFALPGGQCNSFAPAHSPRRSASGSSMAGALPARADAVLAFWFGPTYSAHVPQPAAPGYWPPGAETKLWFRGGPEVDDAMRAQFGGDVAALADGAYDGWLQQQPLAGLAGILLADQFSRNIYRGSAQAFSLDAKALQWSAHLRAHHDLRQLLPPWMRYFVGLPLMHSEALQDQEDLVVLFQQELAAAAPGSAEAAAWADVLTYAERHRDVVARWGRFPHRNARLGRPDTPEEAAGLADGSIPRW